MKANRFYMIIILLKSEYFRKDTLLFILPMFDSSCLEHKVHV